MRYEYRSASCDVGRTFVTCRCLIASDFFGGMIRFPFFIFSVFLFAFFCFSASFEVPWAIVVGEVFGYYLCIWPAPVGCPCSLSLFLASLRLFDLGCGGSAGFVWEYPWFLFDSDDNNNDDDHDPLFVPPLPLAMSASTHRPSPRSTLPAFPVQRRSRSPPSGSVPSSAHLRRSLSPKGVRLPPIQSLDFAPRPAPREPVSSQPLGTPLQDHYPQ